MVTRRRAVSRQKQNPSTLAQDLNTGAVAALDRAREIPPGDERTEAMHKAMALRNAAELHQLLGRKRGGPDLRSGRRHETCQAGDTQRQAIYRLYPTNGFRGLRA
jgi:hypothetical protein